MTRKRKYRLNVKARSFDRKSDERFFFQLRLVGSFMLFVIVLAFLAHLGIIQ